MSFKLLVYIVFILIEYEKDMEKATPGITERKGFMYPPVIPIVYYDGKAEWTAPLDFLYKTEASDIFHRYIPKFEYELIDLNKYSDADIMKFNRELLLFLLLDTVKDAKGAEELLRSKGEHIKNIDIKPPLKGLLVTIARGFLKRANAAPEVVEKILENIEKGRARAMFEGLLEVIDEKNAQVERAFEEREKAFEEREKAYAELAEKAEKEVAAVKKMYSKGQSIEDIADILNLSLERVVELTKKSLS
jgi:hypothetical protein